MWNTPDQPLGPPPEWENEDAYNAAWEVASHGDELYEENLEFKIDNLLDTALWDDDTKHEFGWRLPLGEMTNGEMQQVIDYLWQYQPRVPFSQVKNPTQKQISAFIQKVCNL